MKTRRPAVAGRFYPGSKADIIKMLNQLADHEAARIKTELSENHLIGGVVPHAGYVFSGNHALHFFEIVRRSAQRFDTFVIINPNHTSYAPSIALDTNEAWQTPLGTTLIDKDFAAVLPFEQSETAHHTEHSGEVMLPFLQHFIKYDFKILPVTLSVQTVETAKTVAQELYEANQKLKKNILIIASSDFSHYVEADYGKKMDDYVVNQILKLNSEGVYKEVTTKRISVCGYCPIMALIEYSKLVSQNPQIEILSRGHSGEIMPSNEVVDYISMLFYTNPTN